MAIQNFLSGGFYGSIGKLTGRRWKNKRVVQTKFKPKNPRTPAQQEQRRLFTQGSALAKIAQQVNWKAPQFENPIRTDWNQRQSIAIDALKNGQTEWEALPLAPTTFKPQHTIGTCTLQSIDANNIIQVVFEGTNLEANKKYACAIFIQSGDKKGQIIVGSTPEASVDALTASFRLTESDGIEGEEVYIKIASIDDTTTDTVTLSAGIYLQQKSATPYEFNATLQSITYVAPNQLKIAVKIGAETIESYDPFTNINIRIYDNVWLKSTAVNTDTLSTDNATRIDTSLDIVRTTVAKSSATVTFVAQYENIPNIEKYAAKIDISFTANNVKGTDSAEATESLRIAAQTFPEYLQPIYTPIADQPIYIRVANREQMNGTWVLSGNGYTNTTQTAENKVLCISNTYDEEAGSYDNIQSITLTDSREYTGEELEELLDNYGLDMRINGEKFGIGIYDDEIVTFSGTIEYLVYSDDMKIALYGYRVAKIPEDSYKTRQINLFFQN